VLTLTNMADVPCLLSDGTIFIGGIVGKDNRVDVDGSTGIWSPFFISEGIEIASNRGRRTKAWKNGQELD
jgi:hypothetical protein